jgi:hypothetical protein
MFLLLAFIACLCGSAFWAGWFLVAYFLLEAR